MSSATDKLCLGMAMVYSFFGITLFLAPATFWGPDSPLSYWTAMDESGIWFRRTLGVCMTATTTSPWTAGVPKSALAKLYLVPNVLMLLLFIQAAFYLDTTGPGVNAMLPVNMWWTQLPIAAGLLVLNLQAVGEVGEKGKAA